MGVMEEKWTNSTEVVAEIHASASNDAGEAV